MKKKYFVKFLLILLSLSVFVFSCRTDQAKKYNYNSDKTDSINLLIKQLSSTENSNEKKQLILSNAYNISSKIVNDSLKAKYLFKILMGYYDLEDYRSFSKLNQEYLNLGINLGDTLKIADFHWNKASYFVKHEVLDSAYIYYDNAQNLFQKIGHKYFTAKMQYNMSYVLRRTKDYSRSEIYAIKAIENLEGLDKKLLLYRCYNHLGLLFNDLSQFKKSISYHKKSINLLHYIENNQILKERSLNNLSLVYQKQGKYDLAIDALNQALDNKDLPKLNYNLYAKIIDNRAYCEFLKGDTLGVFDEFNRALDMRKELGNEAGIVISKMHLAEYFLKGQDSVKASQLATEANEIAGRLHLNRDILTSLHLLSVTDPDNANVYMGRYAALNDSLQQEERLTRNKFTRIQYETEGYIAENKELQQKNIWISLSSALTLGSLVLLFFNYFQRSKNKNLMLEKKQQNANEEIYNLMLKQQSKTEEGRIEERVRISEELHDGVLAKLFSVRIGMGFLNLKGKKQDEKQYKAFMDELQSVEKEIRLISHALKNDELSSKEDFPILLQELLEEQSALGGFAAHLEWDDSIAWDRVSDQIKINLYRIAQEALYNVIKHASCSEVNVYIRKNSNFVELLIIDNGKGFDLKKNRKGIGLKNMRSRISSIGADIDIIPSSEEGTTIKIIIPTKILYHDPKE